MNIVFFFTNKGFKKPIFVTVGLSRLDEIDFQQRALLNLNFKVQNNRNAHVIVAETCNDRTNAKNYLLSLLINDQQACPDIRLPDICEYFTTSGSIKLKHCEVIRLGLLHQNASPTDKEESCRKPLSIDSTHLLDLSASAQAIEHCLEMDEKYMLSLGLSTPGERDSVFGWLKFTGKQHAIASYSILTTKGMLAISPAVVDLMGKSVLPLVVKQVIRE